jgi:hypothetical protein
MPSFSHPQQKSKDAASTAASSSSFTPAASPHDESNILSSSMTLNKTTSSMIGAALPHMKLEREALALDEDEEE